MSNSPKIRRFAGVLKIVPFEIESNGSIQKYRLMELDGTHRDVYMNKIRDNTVVSQDGKPLRMKTFEGSQSGLLALCVFDANNKQVPEETIQMWPASTLTALFNMAQEMSKLNVSEDET